MALRGRWRSYNVLLSALRGINGRAGGYWHDVGGRVYQRLVRPEDGLEIAMPFLCAPLVSAQPSYETRERGNVEATWRVSVYGFLPELNQSMDTDSAEQVLKLHDDVQRSVLLNPTLSGTAQDVRWIGGGEEISAIIVGETYTEIELVIEVLSYYAAEDLGPLAV